MACTEAHLASCRKWVQNNKEHKYYLADRTASRRFIRSKATVDDLNELQKMIDSRRIELEKA